VITALAVVGGAGASHRVNSPVKGSFKYCDNPTFPPMESKTSSGKVVGYDVDMANAIAKLWKVKPKFVFSSFEGLLPALGAKRCDVVISGIFITPDRVKQYPAVPYMKTHRALVVKGGIRSRSKGLMTYPGRTSRFRLRRSTRTI
jgi:polar amino acid transport system substrate-binding protein